MVASLKKELEIRQQYLKGERIDTIYFGGGTPSLLEGSEISSILSSINNHFDVEESAEITLEANPDDLSLASLKVLQHAGINRLSIGIQSFDNAELSFMNRAHNSSEAWNAVRYAQDIGIENISIDLMYGLPNSNLLSWENALKSAIELHVPHISAYCLTIEAKTMFGNLSQQKKLQLPEEEVIAQQFEMMTSYLGDHDYTHYEVSNFCLSNRHAIHNSNYWKMKKYLGIGPSAHSFDLVSRQFNIKNNHQYMDSIANGKILYEREELSNLDQANDYLLTSLRTIWGCDLSLMKAKFEIDLTEKYALVIASYIESALLQKSNNIITLTPRGMLLADQITSSLFIES